MRLIPEDASNVIVGYPPTYRSRVCACEHRRRLLVGTIYGVVLTALTLAAVYGVWWAGKAMAALSRGFGR